MTDREWALVAPLLPPAKAGGRPRTTDLRAVVDGLFYLLTTGCQWRQLPKDFPPFTTVQYHFYRLRDGGVLFLGPSEMVGSGERLESISKKHRVYRHVGRSRPGEVAFPAGVQTVERILSATTAKPPPERAADFEALSRRALNDGFSGSR